ncbi:hypothetical protein PV327_004961 [Microctonus hyperodae]|uniref:Uncharacterized protein n=1 Tax=Microctonus hyperodae TaxID=165561 RepID=A0AA39FDJ2_MICHY|nr:hypothetical protein PV327_004961 [Microctonus hyperodae]
MENLGIAKINLALIERMDRNYAFHLFRWQNNFMCKIHDKVEPLSQSFQGLKHKTTKEYDKCDDPWTSMDINVLKKFLTSNNFTY